MPAAPAIPSMVRGRVQLPGRNVTAVRPATRTTAPSPNSAAPARNLVMNDIATTTTAVMTPSVTAERRT